MPSAFTSLIKAALGILIVACFCASPASAQVQTNAPPVVEGAEPVPLERIKVYSPAMEGNLEGEAVERDVIVALPPSYESEATRRYPVVYALHGYSIGPEQWIREIHVPAAIEGAFASGTDEMIVVFPNSRTVHNGSMYSSSVTTGDFERFIAEDVVAHIDATYRTIPQRESRGLVGHSMGGYGATRIGMKHADVFGAVYIMSPCCLSPRGLRGGPETMAALEDIESIEEAQQLGWGQRATLATAAAWSPNPDNPPLYLDLPVKDGEMREDVMAKWAANAPLAFLDQYVRDLRRYNAIAIDVGDEDGLAADTRKLHEALEQYDIEHDFEVYDGDHTNNIGIRFQGYVMPFFGNALAFETGE